MNALTGLDQWHAIAETRDVTRLEALIDADAVFGCLASNHPQVGRDLVVQYLAESIELLGGPAFRYIGEWRGETGAVLEFVTELDGVTINGVDIIRLTADGRRIVAFKVMVRPLKAINLVHRLMGEMLGRSS